MNDFIEKLNTQIIICKKFLETLDSNILIKENVLKWFQELCLNFTNITTLIVEFKKSLLETTHKESKQTLFLHLKQCSTLLCLLVNIFVKETEISEPLTEARNFVTKQLFWCLDGICNSLQNKVCDDPSNNFISWMDKSLDKLAEIYDAEGREMQIVTEAKLLIEEVLCHAMSISQIALPVDQKIIKGSSQAVLNSLEQLINEISEPLKNKAMVNLFADSCNDKLCALESKVNTAVLRLSLQVFSEYTQALQEIHDFCFNRENRGQTDKLDVLVADFDMHIDRIMQIGLFAVSVTSPTERIVKIRSCLASLEGLESELIPALTAVLQDDSVHNVNFALTLEKHWIQESKILQELIFLIIDPLAFCQVIYEENKQIIEKLSEIVDKGINRKVIEPFIKNSTVLKDFMPIAIKESEESNNVEQGIKDGKIKNSLTNFKTVFYELKAACKTFLTDNINSSNLGSTKILKRCRVLMTCIKDMRTYYVQHEIPQCTDTDLPEDTAKEVEAPKTFFEHIVNRGNQILKDRSILYRSSIKTSEDVRLTAVKKINIMKGQRNKSLPLSKLVHLKKFSALDVRSKLDLNEDNSQISDILQDLSQVSHYLHEATY